MVCVPAIRSEMNASRRARVVVTGVAGFIGSNLADRLLAAGYDVLGIDDLSQGVREQVPAGVAFHRADIRSPEIHPLFRDAIAVFHLAAKNCISDCQLDPVTTASVNRTGVWGGKNGTLWPRMTPRWP